jgi:hypothetical protein
MLLQKQDLSNWDANIMDKQKQEVEPIGPLIAFAGIIVTIAYLFITR